MKRDRHLFLTEWLLGANRKPLIIRGARQVGKTWLVRNFAQSQQLQLIEINFEKKPDLASLFLSNNPNEILINISAYLNKKIDPSQSLLFLDEIQAASHLLAKLRWFAEEMPQLPVITAGSLLDFALAKHEFSMPVGRVNYLYLEPLSFEEFLDACQQQELRIYLENFHLKSNIPEAIHLQLMKFIKEYLIIGGMPAAVSNWVTEQDLNSVSQIHFDLLTTFREDFAKYSGRLPLDRLEKVMSSVPRQLGNKFVYTIADSEVNSSTLKQALELLVRAKVCHLVSSTSANGLPLGAETNEKFFKMIMLDSGLCSTSLGLSMHEMKTIHDISLINRGGMTEQLVGQLLRTITPGYISPSLFYWQRTKKGSDAEIDYVIQQGHQVIPIEVKSGSAGSLKSLREFMKEKERSIALRINSDIPSLCPVQVKDAFGHSISYQLLSIPFYLVGQVNRLLQEVQNLSI